MSLAFCYTVHLGGVALVPGGWKTGQLAGRSLVALTVMDLREDSSWESDSTLHDGVQALTCYRLAGTPLEPGM